MKNRNNERKANIEHTSKVFVNHILNILTDFQSFASRLL